MPRVTQEVMENHLRTLCYMWRPRPMERRDAQSPGRRSEAHVLTVAACRAEADRVPQAR